MSKLSTSNLSTKKAEKELLHEGLSYFFQNLGNMPQQSSIPLSAFSAICMSALMESMPVSIFSNCSVFVKHRN